MGARIAGVSGLEGCKWEFVVVQDKTLNAFALPGGKVKKFSKHVCRDGWIKQTLARRFCDTVG